MITLRSKYKGLHAKEIDIKRELRRANTAPTVKLILWFDEVENLRNQAKDIEKSSGNKSAKFFSAYKLSRKMDRHRQAFSPRDVLTMRRLKVYVDQCPERSKLLDTIWGNLMDPSVGIISIYGGRYAGKTTAMTEVSTRLSKSGIFDAIITVSVSEDFSLHKVQSDIALQINLVLPARNRATMLLEAFHKIGRFLIIFDDLWVPIPLWEMAIPQPNGRNGSKIVLITRSFDVCPPMKPDKVIRIDPPSQSEKWDMFVGEAGNTVLGPQASKYLPTMWEKIMDSEVGIISIYGGLVNFEEMTSTKKIIRVLKNSGIFDEVITFPKMYDHNMEYFGFQYIRDDIDREGMVSYIQSKFASQLGVGLPDHDNNLAAMLFEAFQNIGKFLIILYDLRSDISLFELGIPRPNKGNDSKIILINRRFHVCCSHMKPDVIIRMDSLSQGEKCDMFVEKAGKTLVAPERSKLLGTIWENLMDPSVGIISIYGYEGVGKTTAMTKTSTQLSKSGIFDSVITVSLSEPNNFHKVQSDIAMRMNLNLPSHDRAAKLLEAFQEIGKFVIIIDDLWEPIALSSIGIPRPNRGSGSKIVFIGRKFDVCSSMLPDKIIRIDPLSQSEKWDMFVEKAGNTVLAPEISPFARLIVDICPNLPFLVTMIGQAMRDESSLEAWSNAEHDLRTSGDTCTEGIIGLCYSRLKDETLQNCFLYCALFPHGHLFKSEELIKYWIGESFIEKDRNIVTEIDIGFKIIRELVDANMLEMFTVNEDDMLKVRPLCRNLAIDIMKEEPRFWVNGILKEARKISMVQSHLQMLDASPFNSSSNVYVSTLLLNNNPTTYIYNSYFSRMHALSLLDLSHTCIEELPKSLSKLVKLRALFLQYCRKLSRIPSLKEMKELQIMNLCGTAITELPEGMEELVSLRSLNLSETTQLENIRVGLISSLSSLQELLMQGSGLCKMYSTMVASYLMEMRCLKQLAILNISTVGCDDLLDTVVCLQQQNLQIYSINLYGSAGDYDEDV